MLDTQIPAPAEIYRRRRMAAGGALAVIVLLIVGIIALLTGSDSPVSQSDEPIVSDGGAVITPINKLPAVANPIISNAQGKSVNIPQCADSTIAVTVNTDKPNYKSGEQPIFKAIITNAGGEQCVRNIGTGMQQFQVLTLDGVHIWSNFDCSFERGMKNQVLEPGQQVGFSLQWMGRKSMPKCPKNSLHLVAVGPYQVIASIGTVQSQPVTFNIQ